MSTGGKIPRARARGDREERERARVYQARIALHESRQRRKVRDNWIAGIAGGLIVLGAIGSQVAYYTVGAGAPSPAPVPTPTTTSTPAPTTDPTPEPTSTP